MGVFDEFGYAPATAMPAMIRTGATRMLAEFHEALGDARGRGNAPLRVTLHVEEHDELVEALEACADCEKHVNWGGRGACDDCRKVLARELADVLYIAYGTAHAFNIDLDAALAEIHRAAMSKLFPTTGERVVREDGKVMKPPGFIAPDMTTAVGE